jgi:hypothetical protein
MVVRKGSTSLFKSTPYHPLDRGTGVRKPSHVDPHKQNLKQADIQNQYDEDMCFSNMMKTCAFPINMMRSTMR